MKSKKSINRSEPWLGGSGNYIEKLHAKQRKKNSNYTKPKKRNK